MKTQSFLLHVVLILSTGLAAADEPEKPVVADYANYQFDPQADEMTLSHAALAWQHKSPTWQDVPNFRGSRDVESPVGQWTRVECTCAGDRITVHVNGQHVNQARNLFPSAGKILLQCEGSEVFFRKIELHPLQAATQQ